MKEQISIYRIYFPESDKCYIGQTNNLKHRMYAHLRGKKGWKSLVHRALLKYDDWDISVLHTRQSRDAANCIEIEEIRNFNSVSPNGYNLTHGGDAESPSEETRQKLRAANIGKKLTDEHRAKIGAASVGRKHTDETKAKMSATSIGRKFTDETRAKISASKVGRRLTDEHRAKIGAANIGKKLTDETRAKISEANIGRKFTDVHRAKIRAANIGRKHTDETKAKMSAANSGKNNPMYGKKASDETKAKMSATRTKTAFKKLMKEFSELREILFEQGTDIDGITTT